MLLAGEASGADDSQSDAGVSAVAEAIAAMGLTLETETSGSSREGRAQGSSTAASRTPSPLEITPTQVRGRFTLTVALLSVRLPLCQSSKGMICELCPPQAMRDVPVSYAWMVTSSPLSPGPHTHMYVCAAKPC